jgi:hypothetical protein
MAPYAEFSYSLDAIRKLYLARTEEENLFVKPSSEKSRVKKESK